MDPAQRCARDEAFKRLETERKLPDGQGPLGRKAAPPKTVQVLRKIVVGSIDDPEIVASPAFDGRLEQAISLGAYQERRGLYHHAFAARCGHLHPPVDCPFKAAAILQ